MPRLKYDKDTLQRMLSQVAKSQKNQITKEHRVEPEPSKMLRKISQHCIRCGRVTVFSIDQLGYAICTRCKAMAPDRHSAV